MLAETFHALLEKEREAEKLYAGLAGQITDPSTRRHVEQIHREKLHHVKLVERLLEIVE